MQARNQGASSRLTVLSPVAFKAIIYQDGTRVAGCHVRTSSGFSADSIAYSGKENARGQQL